MTNTPVADLVRNALDFANQIAGEGMEIYGISPEYFLMEYSVATGDEDWDTLPDRIAAALTPASAEPVAEIARLTAERDQALVWRDAHKKAEAAAHDAANAAIAQRDQALARAAAAAMEMRERAVKWHEEVIDHDQGGIDYSDAVGIPISNRYELEQSVKAHEYSAREIRALPIPTDAQKALDKVLAKAREDAIREASHLIECDGDALGGKSGAAQAILALLNHGGRDE